MPRSKVASRLQLPEHPYNPEPPPPFQEEAARAQSSIINSGVLRDAHPRKSKSHSRRCRAKHLDDGPYAGSAREAVREVAFWSLVLCRYPCTPVEHQFTGQKGLVPQVAQHISGTLLCKVSACTKSQHCLSCRLAGGCEASVVPIHNTPQSDKETSV